METSDKKRAARERDRLRHQEIIEKSRHFPTPKEKIIASEAKLAEKRKALQVARICLNEALETVERLTMSTIPKLQEMIPAIEQDICHLQHRLKKEKPIVECTDKIARLRVEIARLRRSLKK